MSGTVYYPQFWCLLNSSQSSVTSVSRCQPRQIVTMPGSPSPFRPRNPPSWAIHRTACLVEGGFIGGEWVLLILQHRAFHSCSANSGTHGSSGHCRLIWVIQWSLQAIIANRAKYLDRRFADPSRHDSTWHPDLRILWKTSIPHLSRYHSIFSVASSKVVTLILVSSIHSNAAILLGGLTSSIRTA